MAPPADAVRSAEAAKLLGIGQSQLHRLARSGRLPPSLPPDGVYRGRRWWLPHRVGENL
ncbi:helix-turn-helix domain-containing protein [Terrabacter sp. AAH1]